MAWLRKNRDDAAHHERKGGDAQAGDADGGGARHTVYESGGRVDLTREVESARPEDVQVDPLIAKLAAYAFPTLLDMVRRTQVLPYVLVLKRRTQDECLIEPIEEALHAPADLIAYMERRLENDGRGTDNPVDGYGGEVDPLPIEAYGCMYDERNFVEDDGVSKDFCLVGLFGCDQAPQGVAVRQRFRPRLFGGADLVGPPTIGPGPTSVFFEEIGTSSADDESEPR